MIVGEQPEDLIIGIMPLQRAISHQPGFEPETSRLYRHHCSLRSPPSGMASCAFSHQPPRRKIKIPKEIGSIEANTELHIQELSNLPRNNIIQHRFKYV